MKRVPVVPPELGVDTLERGVAVGLGLLDTVSRNGSERVRFHSAKIRWNAGGARRRRSWIARRLEVMRTRYGEPSWTGCAETSSWTLRSSILVRKHRSLYAINLLAMATDFLVQRRGYGFRCRRYRAEREVSLAKRSGVRALTKPLNRNSCIGLTDPRHRYHMTLMTLHLLLFFLVVGIQSPSDIFKWLRLLPSHV